MAQNVRYTVYPETDDVDTIRNLNSIQSLFNVIDMVNNITEYNNTINNRNIFSNNQLNVIDVINVINTFQPFYEDFEDTSVDILNTVLRESMEDGFIEKNDEQKISVSSQRYDTIVKGTENDEECIICTEKFEKDCFVSVLCCEHHFHTNCIEEWGKYKNVCPICRTEIPKIE
jgi:hypothetical protein